MLPYTRKEPSGAVFKVNCWLNSDKILGKYLWRNSGMSKAAGFRSVTFYLLNNTDFIFHWKFFWKSFLS